MQLFGLLFLAEVVAGIYLLVVSPQMLRTLGRMALAFVVCLLMTLVPSALLRIGHPRAWGQLAGVVAPFVAVVAGWLNVRSLRHSQVSAAPTGPSV